MRAYRYGNDCICDANDVYHDHDGLEMGTATRHAEISTAVATNDYADKHRHTYAYNLALAYDFDHDCLYNDDYCNGYNDDTDRSYHRKRDSGF